jgi:hypothetical protein
MTDHSEKTLVLLTTVRAVVDALGETDVEAAARLGVGPTAVANWLAKGCIPPSWYFRISDELGALGYEADRSLFRQYRKDQESAA